MATVVQQKQNCMKSLNVANTAGTIILATPNQVSVGGNQVSANNSNGNGNLLVSQGQQILLTHNGVGQGNVNVITVQQYQQLLQQNRIQQQTINSTHVNNASPLGTVRIATSATPSGLNAVTAVAASRFKSAASVAQTTATGTINTSMSSFQQQFQQQIAAAANNQQQQMLIKQRPTQLSKSIPQPKTMPQAKPMPMMNNETVAAASNKNAVTVAAPRYFSQFSQSKQQQRAAAQLLPMRAVANVSTSAAANAPNRCTTTVMVARATQNLLPGSLTLTPRYQPANWLKRTKPEVTTTTSAPAAKVETSIAPAYSKNTYTQQQTEPLAKTHYVPTPAQLHTHRYTLKTLLELKQLDQERQTEAQAQIANGVSGYSEAVVPNGHDSNVKAQLSTTNNNKNNTNVTDSALMKTEPESSAPEAEPELDIVINNVVCSFSVRCHLNLRDIAQNGYNVEFRRENGMVTMKLRRPYTTASIWSSGRITCTGATSEEQAKIAARRYARCLQKLGFRTRFQNFRVVNVLGTCSMPWAIKIVSFSERYKEEASYEPELHPGVTYKLRTPKATLKIFSTGSVTVTATCVAHVQAAIEHIFPLLFEFRKMRTPAEAEALRLKQQASRSTRNTYDDETAKKSPSSPMPDLKSDADILEDLESNDDGAAAPKRKRRKLKHNPCTNDDEDADDPIALTDEGNSTDAIIIEGVDPEDLIEEDY